ncbi:MAG: hypothetical protein IPK83_10320 [Planctomycetes bacterium]|nr:hypothetical protein [Planctomycetota bacterium]
MRLASIFTSSSPTTWVPKVTDGCVCRDGGYFIECDGKGDNITTAVKIGRDTPPTDDPALIDNLLAAEEAVRPHVDPLADAQGLVSNLLGPLNSAKEQRAPLLDAIHEQTKKISKMSAGPKRTEEERVLRLRKEALQVFDSDILLPRQQAYDNASRAMQATRTTFDTAKAIETGHRQALSTANRSRAAASELGTATASPLKTWSGKMYLDDEDA